MGSSLFRRTLIAVILVFGVTANATALLSAWLLHRHLTDEYVTKGRAIAMAIAAACPDALVAGDDASVQAMIDEFLHIEGVGYVVVLDRRGKVAAHTFVPAIPGDVPGAITRRNGVSIEAVTIPKRGDFLQVTAPILAGEAGQVSVGMDKAGIWQVMRGAVVRQEALMLAMLAVAVVVFYVLIGGITRPLTELAGYAVKIRNHDFAATPPVVGNDEVGVLARTMSGMAGQLATLVSDLKQTVAETTSDLQDALAHTQAIIDNLADGLLVVDGSGLVTLFNPALLTLFGLSPDEVTHKPAAEVFPQSLSEVALAARDGDATASAEVALADGGTGKALATVLRLPGAGQGRRSTILLVRDITMEKEVDRMKTEFISTVSHELRTPLTSVLGFAKIIRRRFLDIVAPLVSKADGKARRGIDQIRDNLDIIVAEGERLTELVDDVLDIAKMESGRYEWDMVPLSLAAVVAHAVKAVGPLAARRDLSLTTDVPDALPAILGDRDRLVQVFMNLIGNAVKFTQQGGIHVAAAQHDGMLKVTVRDTGSGIAVDDLERIFEKFKQAGDTLTEKPKGTGLGLPICRQIVERHGGRIWAESRPGQGSAFVFTLPVAEGEPVPATCPLPEALPVADGRWRILVVDDDEGVRRYLEAVFTDAGYAVALARDGVEALALAARWRPDCITMDLRMPGMGGEEAIRQLRAGEDTRLIPVVVVSVVSSQEREQSGADAAVLKPVDQEALLATVRGLLEGHDAQQGRPSLLYSCGEPGREPQRFFMCPGEARPLCGEAALWQAVDDGFQGTVFIPASLGQGLDLVRLCANPGIHVIILPDDPPRRGIA